MLLIRADASVSMGTGHIMRCLALAQAWQHTGKEVVFGCHEISESLERRLNLEHCQVYRIDRSNGEMEDAAETVDLAAKLSAECVVIDGYQFSYEYQYFVRERSNLTIVVDDYGHCKSYCADILLNQNISACPSLYTTTQDVKSYLLGTSYALLRSEFLNIQPVERVFPPVAKRLLITLGGSDENNFAGRILEQLSRISSPLFEVTLVAGFCNPNLASLTDQVLRMSHHVTILTNVDDMAGLMQAADLAICAGGSSNWELSYFGVPRIQFILADNQIRIAQEIAAIGAGLLANVDLVDFQSMLSEVVHSPAQRESLARESRKLVDGRGARRVVQAINTSKA